MNGKLFILRPVPREEESPACGCIYNGFAFTNNFDDLEASCKSICFIGPSQCRLPIKLVNHAVGDGFASAGGVFLD